MIQAFAILTNVISTTLGVMFVDTEILAAGDEQDQKQMIGQYLVISEPKANTEFSLNINLGVVSVVGLWLVSSGHVVAVSRPQ